MRLHPSPDHETWHKGPRAECARCKAAAKKNLTKAFKNGGSAGGRKAAEARIPSPECSGCGRKISRDNKSGMCIRCLREKQRLDAAAKAKAPPKLCECGRRLPATNTSGICRMCWNKSPEAMKFKKAGQNWLGATVFKKSAGT